MRSDRSCCAAASPARYAAEQSDCSRDPSTPCDPTTLVSAEEPDRQKHVQCLAVRLLAAACGWMVTRGGGYVRARQTTDAMPRLAVDARRECGHSLCRSRTTAGRAKSSLHGEHGCCCSLLANFAFKQSLLVVYRVCCPSLLPGEVADAAGGGVAGAADDRGAGEREEA
jgi:hypothetical protein